VELYLHIGAHRTGSTAFQRILAKNARALEQGGTVVWGPDALRKRSYFYLPPKDGFAEGAQEAWARDVAAVTADRLVISEENIIGTMLQNLRARAFYPDFGRRMAEYAGLFNATPARIGLAIREYGSYWTSSYTYTLPRHPLPPFPELKTGLLKIERGWLDMIRELRAQFPTTEIMVWPLEAVQDTMRDMTARFLGQPGPGLSDIERRINVSRGAHVVPLIHEIRAAHPGIAPDALHAKLKGTPLPAVPPEPLFTDDEALDLAMRYADELSALEMGFEGVRFVAQPGADE